MPLNKAIALIVGTAAVIFPLLSTAPSAQAFTAADATAAWNSYNSAFYNSGGYYTKYSGGGGQDTSDMWQNAEEIEMAVDRAERTGATSDYNTVWNLIFGFDYTFGHTWTTYGSGQTFNDDVLWVCLAHLRAYVVCPNHESSWANDAFNNYYILCYGGAGRSVPQYDTTYGCGMWWTTDHSGSNPNSKKAACVNGPGCLVGWYLNQIYGGNKWYYNYSYGCYCLLENLYDDAKNNGYNGMIYDSINNSGPTGTADFSYNVGTFLGSAGFWGDTARGNQALYYFYWISNNGGDINYYCGTNDGDEAGFNGIFYRWAANYAWKEGLWNTYSGWLYNNIDTGWAHRNGSDLLWNCWSSATPGGTRGSWECSDIVAAMSAMGPNQ